MQINIYLQRSNKIIIIHRTNRLKIASQIKLIIFKIININLLHKFSYKSKIFLQIETHSPLPKRPINLQKHSDSHVNTEYSNANRRVIGVFPVDCH